MSGQRVHKRPDARRRLADVSGIRQEPATEPSAREREGVPLAHRQMGACGRALRVAAATLRAALRPLEVGRLRLRDRALRGTFRRPLTTHFQVVRPLGQSVTQGEPHLPRGRQANRIVNTLPTPFFQALERFSINRHHQYGRLQFAGSKFANQPVGLGVVAACQAGQVSANRGKLRMREDPLQWSLGNPAFGKHFQGHIKPLQTGIFPQVAQYIGKLQRVAQRLGNLRPGMPGTPNACTDSMPTAPATLRQ